MALDHKVNHKLFTRDKSGKRYASDSIQAQGLAPGMRADGNYITCPKV
jgi:hypothetical protein